MTMEAMLKDNNTLYLSGSDTEIYGNYLKKTSWGMVPSSLGEDELPLVEHFKLISESLKAGQTLQMYCGDLSHMYTIMLGHVVGEGPYGEQDCLDDVIVTYDNNPLGALMSLEQAILEQREFDKNKELKKAYRLYGSDKYQFYNNV